MLAALAFAPSRTLWGYSTIAEVYALHAFLQLSVFALLLRWRTRWLQGSEARREADGWLYAAAFVFGLSLCVHHLTALLALPAFVIFVWRSGAGFAQVRRVLGAVVALAAPLAFYLYLPLAALRGPVLNWGNPRTPLALWRHVTGWQYRVYFSFAASEMAREVAAAIAAAGSELGPPWLPAIPLFAIAGWMALWRSDRTVFWFLVARAGADVAHSASYAIAEDKVRTACLSFLPWRSLRLTGCALPSLQFKLSVNGPQ